MTGKKWIWIVLGLLVGALLLCGGLVGTVTYFALRHLNIRGESAESAERQFEQVRARFEGKAPLIEVDEDDWSHPRVKLLPAEPPQQRLQTMHIMAWDNREGKMVRLDLPMWILRFNLRGRIIAYPSDRFADLDRLKLTVEDLERHGPGLIVDHRGRRGDRVLVWTE